MKIEKYKYKLKPKINKILIQLIIIILICTFIISLKNI